MKDNYNLQLLCLSWPWWIPRNRSRVGDGDDVQSTHLKAFDCRLEWQNNYNNYTTSKYSSITILPGPKPLTAILTDLVPRSIIFVAIEIAVAWAAMFVPFLVFLNPSIPQLLKICGSPFELVRVIIVLLGDVFICTMGISLKGTP